jgi:sulfane dehydrogenase subunit SoxC
MAGTQTPSYRALVDGDVRSAVAVGRVGVHRGGPRCVQGGEEHHYARSLTIAEATRPEMMLAYEMDGQPLPPQHGYPVRLLVPGWYGMTSVKWLCSIDAVTQPFDGFQQRVAYRYQHNADDPGIPVTRIRVRCLMVPPGIPDFFTRRRIVRSGSPLLRGRAWSGRAPIERVEVAVDGRWRDAQLHRQIGRFAWRGWSLEWDARRGDHELACRATDASGDVQPDQQTWNHQGMGNTAVQRMTVTVQ